MKQNILNVAGMAALMACLAGCDEIKFGGAMNVYSPITFWQEGTDPYTCNQQPDPWNCKPAGNVVVNPGQFSTDATLGMNGQQKQIRLDIKNANPPTAIELNFDKNIEIGEQFTLTAAQIKQNFDLTGTMLTKVEKSAEQSGTEYCTYQYPQTVCRGGNTKSADEAAEKLETEISKFGHFPGGQYGGHGGFPPGHLPFPQPVPAFPGQYGPGYGGPGYGGPGYGGPNAPTCHTEWITRPGSMYVRFYYETTLRDIKAGFVQGNVSLADYQGHSSVTRTVYTYKSQCH